MKRVITSFVLAGFLFVLNPVFAQETAPKPENETKTEDKSTGKEYKYTSYMMLGVYGALDYFIAAKDSTENTGIFIKLPMHKAWGIEANYGSYVIPITSYNLNTVSYSGFGEEEYNTIGLDVLWFAPFLQRHFQVKGGFDYYRLIRGSIANGPGAATGGCGTTQQICYNCSPNLFGVNVGVNLDVPIYEKFYFTTSFMLKYLLNHQAESVPIEFRVGLAYRLK